ncbi:TROVE domain-containing protein [bacterium]|nr:TROVE domain-containing protein [bacterium]
MLTKHFNNKKTAQNQPIPEKKDIMEKNNAGGYSYSLTNKKKLKRFLILGTEGGSYYESEKDLTIKNTNSIVAFIKKGGGKEALEEAISVSFEGKARKNDYAIFTLALVLTYGTNEDKEFAVENVDKICRIGTHIFKLAQYLKDLRGWGKYVKKIFTNWYLKQSVKNLAFQTVKYQSRDGWSHRDLLRLNHIKTDEKDRDLLFYYATKKESKKNEISISDFETLKIVEGFEKAKEAKTEKEIISLLYEYRLTREMIPTQFLNKPNVIEALLPNLGLTSLIRSLGSFSASGYLNNNNLDAINYITSLITKKENIKKARLHPLQILDALYTYNLGHGIKGNLNWNKVSKIVDALDDSFYLSFETVEPTNKKLMLAIDVSGSMGGYKMSGSVLTPRVASMALALVTAKVEKNYIIKAFSDKLVDIDVTPKMRLEQIIHKTNSIPFGGTDCALPMVYAKENKIHGVDAFIIYTDNETWFGKIHPSQAIKEYRKFTGNRSKLITAGMVSNNFSIADPTDANMFDVVGFSTETPKFISEYIMDRV